MILIEAAVETLRSARAAQDGGAGRIELCAALNDGGTTPSVGVVEAVIAQIRIPVFAMVRVRPGNFHYSEDELAIMLRDVAVLRQLGVDGIVFGALTADSQIDTAAIRRVLDAAQQMPVTFHRAFDRTPDLDQSLDTLIELGISRVLTSGGAASALEGADRLARLVARSAGRIHIMAGGGVREGNARDILERSHAHELHTRLVSGNAWEELDAERMRSLVQAVR